MRTATRPNGDGLPNPPLVTAPFNAWHQRHVRMHLAELGVIRDGPEGPADRLAAVLSAFARNAHLRQESELGALLHNGSHLIDAHRELADMLTDLIADAAAAGDIRRDIDPRELARYCLHALSAASAMPSGAAVERLVSVTLHGLQPDC